MQLVVQNQESIIIEVEAQKKSHRGWAHRGNYLDGLGNKGGASSSSGNEIPSSASSSSSTSQASSSSKGPQGGLGNYLNQLGSASTSATSDSTKDSSSSSSAPKMKPKWQPASKATTKSGSYLDSLNSPKTPNDDKTSEPKLTAKKDQVSAAPPSSSEEPTITMKTSSSESLPQVPKPKTTGMRGGSYLDGLSSNTIESTNQDDTTSSQSNKIIENPHFEPVRRVSILSVSAGDILDYDSHQSLNLAAQKTVEFQFDVDPGALVTRMLSVREQIAREWKDDLATLVRTNERILDEYEEQQRVLEAAAAAEDEEEEDDDDDDDNDGKSPVVEIRDYLKDMASPYRASQEDGKTVTYDRSAMVYLTNSIASQGQAASPFRRSNFDLLLLLCTQESIHRVLMEYKNDSDDEMHMDKFNLLNTFYKTNVEKYFDGHEHSFGRGDQFLEAFLKEPRIGRTTQKGNLSVIDPVAIMEDLLRERSRVAREWKSIINMIPDEHLGLRRLLFNRHLMESSNWDTSGYGTFVTHVEESASIHSVPEPGAFE